MNVSDDTLPLRRFPSRIAQLGFAVGLPADWISHPLPDEQPDFADPSLLVPLAAVTAPHAAIVWAAAARPAYGDGTLSDWARYLVAQHGLTLRAFGEGQLGSLPALVGEAVQDSEVGPLRVRFVFAEDGGRLINLTLTAPEMLADAVVTMWFSGLASFALEDPHGATVPLWPAVVPAPSTDAVAAMAGITPVDAELPADATLSHVAAEPDAAPVAASLAAPDAAPDAGPDAESDVAPSAARPFAVHARAEGASTLDAEHPVNRRLRDNGVGLVPRVVDVDARQQCATLACGSITAQLTLPLGWHVIDDGRRVLVFEPAGEVQVHLDLLASEESGHGGALDQLEAQARRDYPAPEFQRLSAGRLSALAVRGIADGDQPLEQFHLLIDGPDTGHLLRARVTATPATAAAAANMGELILDSAVFGSFAATTQASDHGPDWWMAALLMERADRLAEAEQCITDAIDHIGAAIQVAELYRQRMLRLQDEGQPGEGLKAREAAIRWAHHYAACATSGGEGAALTRERDAFISRL
jgi:hypothetical protein